MAQRKVIVSSKDFKKFWKEKGPYKYALTSSDYPPVLLGPEEWVFSNDMTELLKTLMQFNERKMKFVKAPFNPANKKILRPEKLGEWKINNFPEEWNSCVCDCFVPEGHLTKIVIDSMEDFQEEKNADPIEKDQVQTAFFNSLFKEIETMGYLLLKPQGSSKYASIRSYLEEWEEDEKDAGLL